MKDSIEDRLMDNLASDEIKDLVADYSELALDNFIDDEVLKDIPVFGTLFKTYKIAVGIRERFFLKKLYTFLFRAKSIPFEKRRLFLKDIKGKEKTQIGEKLLVVIDKVDDNEKAVLLSNLFEALVEQKIEYKVFHLLCTSLMNSDINDLLDMYGPDGANYGRSMRLSQSGLYTIELKGGYKSENLIHHSRHPYINEIVIPMPTDKITSERNQREGIFHQNWILLHYSFSLTALGKQMILCGLKKNLSKDDQLTHQDNYNI